MKIKLVLTKNEIAEKYAIELGIDVKSIDLEINDEPELPYEEVEFEVIPAPKERFLEAYLKRNKLTVDDAIKLCGVSKSTMIRACHGYTLTNPTYLKIIRGLCMTDEEAQEFRTNMTRHQ